MPCSLHKQDYQRVLELAEIFEKEYSVSLDSRALHDLRSWAAQAREALARQQGSEKKSP